MELNELNNRIKQKQQSLIYRFKDKSGDEDETRPSDLIQAQTCHVKGSFI